MRPVLPAALLAFTLAWSGAAQAERADRNLPMNIEADALRYDDLRQTSIFTGRVVLTKGTIIIRGARVDVRQDAEGFQYGVVTAEPGKRAFYRQKREGVDEYIEGEGETIEYDGKADRVKFIRRAELRRFRGSAMVDEITGGIITYENTSDVFTVDGGAAAPTPGGRVRAMLGPRDGASGPGVPGAARAPAAPAAPPAQLRSSPGLAGEPK
ncbi:MAG TPA: lipopolysaccharide transport periplasmic protein LptA [Ramlibacter sp.]|jgi:lipopolysaccharide export system protein LptA|uniref:lipopolysaccharide transport periplasmic protein LptA n=1 Tax=Ramlibacter sp. TaxID=1917967 RepID=UPI002D6C5FE0|nr:lipopolysaccharide transport periplasmic protein LptA [Ramlibacter sp.]HZY17239.1 lipopolysaccharide transport periplasmic protein LptA [Ramlibacter sp.]